MKISKSRPALLAKGRLTPTKIKPDAIRARMAARTTVVEGAIIAPEEIVALRETVMRMREESSDQREAALAIREREMGKREGKLAARERSNHAIEATLASRDVRLQKLLLANQKLVVTAVQAQVMAEEARTAKDLIDHMAHHDFLTDLPNRLALKSRMSLAIAMAKRHHIKMAVLFIDLDRFKTINDSLGHAVGDSLLRLVAERLSNITRSTDMVSRQGGDEFLVLLSEVADENAIISMADKVCEAVGAPYKLAGQELRIGATIGISVYPDDSSDADTLIQNADLAMYDAKNNGRNRYQFFRPRMNARAVERQRVESELHQALERQEFRLYYQPQVELQTGAIIGVEALIRWLHPTRGLLQPANFMPIAETCGVIVPIGRWVVREACRQASAWREAGLASPVVSVNICAMEFKGKNFVDSVYAALQDYRLPPDRLELELTETVLMDNAEATMCMLETLKSMGVRIAIDDFGTGYSSLSYLKQFPVDTLKIDQSFVAGIMAHRDDDILVEAIIGLGKSLRYRVIAEGVETIEQFRFLDDHHCVEGQGFLLSPPLDANHFAHILNDGLSLKRFGRAGAP